jgi:TolB-like protein/tetratricopeptide (TPR) repeat protein
VHATDEGRWARVRELFDELVDLSASERSARLDASSASDPETRRLVEALLNGDARADERLAHVEPRSAPSDPLGLSGRTVSHFRVLEPLGEGGMGVVYRAEDVRLGRIVALKFLLPQLALDAGAKARFLHEARATAVLDHPNVCTVHEVGETEDGHPFLAMSCYEGETLKARLAGESALPVEQATDIASQIARGLARAHAAGIVHRDLKPANVMLTPDGVARILDFGLAKAWDLSLTASGARVGTIAYMSPEQIAGDTVDARTDLWSLGVVLYEMVSGMHPLRGGDVRAARPEVPEALARVVDRLLQSDPEARYASANEVLRDLGATGSAPRSSRRRRFVPGVVVAVALAFVAVAGGVALWRRATDARQATALSLAPSIAVLPLRNYSGDSAQDYFADGMTEELTMTLGKIEGLRVIAHQAVRQFRRSDRTPADISRALGGVRYVVDGSVIQAGDSVHISATLVDVTTNSTLHSVQFERDRRNVLALQREVALALAGRIAVTLTTQDRERLAAARPVDPFAYQLYMKGTQARYLMSMGVGADANTSADYFARAIERDPTFAAPYAGLALTRAFDGQGTVARTLAKKALALDPTLAEADVALGIIYQIYDRDWVAAERALRDAIQVNPGYAEAHHELSMLLLRLARFNDAVYESQQALYLAPTSSRFYGGLGEVYYYGGGYEDALSAAAEAFNRDSTAGLAHGLRAHVYAELGRYRDAEESIRRFEKVSGGGCAFAATLHAYIHARAGARERAREILRVCEDSATRLDQAPAAYYVARVHAALGDRAPALAWLATTSTIGMMALFNVAVDPAFQTMHGDPGFRKIVEKAGLPDSVLIRPRLH